MAGNEAQQLMNLFQELARDGKKQMEQAEQKRKQFAKPLQQEVSRQAVNKGKEVGGQIYDGAKQARDNRINDLEEGFSGQNASKLTMNDFKESAKNFDFKDGVNLVKDAQVENEVKTNFKENFEKEQINAIKKEMEVMSPKKQESFLKHLAQTDKFKEDPVKFSNALGLDNKQKETVLKSMVNGPDKGIGAKISERKNEKILQRTGKEALDKAKVRTVADSIKKNGMNLAKTSLKMSPVVGKAVIAKDLANKLKDTQSKAKGLENLANDKGTDFYKLQEAEELLNQSAASKNAQSRTNGLENLANDKGTDFYKLQEAEELLNLSAEPDKSLKSAPFSNKEMDLNFFDKKSLNNSMNLSAGITNVGAEDKAAKAMVNATKNEISKAMGEPVKDVKSLISNKKEMAEQAAKVNPTSFVSSQLKDNMKDQMNNDRER